MCKGHRLTSGDLCHCIIETGFFAEPEVYSFCLTGWPSCSGNLPVCSVGVRFIAVRCAVMPSVSRIPYITALCFPLIPLPISSQVHPDFLPHSNSHHFLSLLKKKSSTSSVCSTHTYGCGAILSSCVTLPGATQ